MQNYLVKFDVDPSLRDIEDVLGFHFNIHKNGKHKKITLHFFKDKYEEFLKKYCIKYDIPFKIINKPMEMRTIVFSEKSLRNKYNSSVIFVERNPNGSRII